MMGADSKQVLVQKELWNTAMCKKCANNRCIYAFHPNLRLFEKFKCIQCGCDVILFINLFERYFSRLMNKAYWDMIKETGLGGLGRYVHDMQTEIRNLFESKFME